MCQGRALSQTDRQRLPLTAAPFRSKGYSGAKPLRPPAAASDCQRPVHYQDFLPLEFACLDRDIGSLFYSFPLSS